MPRLHLPSADEMTAEQRDVHDEIVSGVRGRLVGPLRAVIHSPDLARRWSRLGEYLRFSTCLPRKLNELAILVTGRRWNSQVEFLIHAEAAKDAGLDPACIEAIRRGEAPTFANDAEAEVYEFARLLQETGNVDDRAHKAIIGPMGRAWRRRTHRRHRLLHDGFDDAQRARNPGPGRNATPPLSAPRIRRPDKIARRASRSRKDLLRMSGTRLPHIAETRDRRKGHRHG